MPRYGYFLSSEEFNPTAMFPAAQQAETVGIDKVLDPPRHPGPTDGHGAASGEGPLPVRGGSGENLNEHILGHRCPPVATRQNDRRGHRDDPFAVAGRLHDPSRRVLHRQERLDHLVAVGAAAHIRIGLRAYFAFARRPPRRRVRQRRSGSRLGRLVRGAGGSVPPWAPSRSATAPTSQRRANWRTTVGARGTLRTAGPRTGAAVALRFGGRAGDRGNDCRIGFLWARP